MYTVDDTVAVYVYRHGLCSMEYLVQYQCSEACTPVTDLFGLPLTGT